MYEDFITDSKKFITFAAKTVLQDEHEAVQILNDLHDAQSESIDGGSVIDSQIVNGDGLNVIGDVGRVKFKFPICGENFIIGDFFRGRNIFATGQNGGG